MKISYYGPFCAATGFGQACHDYLAALERAGADLYVQPLMDVNPEDLDERYRHLLDRVRAPDSQETHRIVHTVPAHSWRFVTGKHEPASDVVKVCLTTWETDLLPRDIAESLYDNFDLIVVPSSWCAYMIDRHHNVSLTRKTVVIPHTFDPNDWHPGNYATEANQYSFLAILGWSERKNPIGLLKAYWSEFDGASDAVLLRILTPSYSKEDVAALAGSMGIEDLAPVEFITERQSHEELLALYAKSNAFVSATRGEAWHLPAFEAALLGLPVISTAWSGHCQFLGDYPNSHPISYQMTPAIPRDSQIQEPMEICGIRVQPVHRVAPTGITARQQWAEPNLEDLRTTMRQAYEEKWQRHFSHRRQFEKDFGYSAIGPLFLRILAEAQRKQHERNVHVDAQTAD